MDTLLYLLARALIALLQALPLECVARLGRSGGALAYWLDARHRRVALKNLTSVFGKEKSPDEIRALAKENFCRIGENYACAIKTAAMSVENLRQYVEFTSVERFRLPPTGTAPPTVVVAIGHFGNFELYARFGQFVPAYQCVTTYRGLRQPSLNRLMQSLRERSGCLYFERRSDGPALRLTMNKTGIMLGLLADQRGHGVRLPFLGHECMTPTAPAVFALRYRCPLYMAICYRIGPGQWQIEIGSEIPTHQNGEPRTPGEIMLDVNRAFEIAVRRDPANWFWVHERWKFRDSDIRIPKFKVQNSEAGVEDATPSPKMED